MSILIADSTTQKANLEFNRPFAKYPPNVWGDHFLVYASDPMKIDDCIKQEHDELKEEVRRMITGAVEKPLEKLELIDAVQRLGTYYHFEKEIEDALEQIYLVDLDSIDLHTASLRFRLLRQQGYRVSCETFNKFKDEEGNFKESIKCDVKGMLSLYEATHLSIHGEDILDDALAFTTTHLENSITVISSPPLAKHVIHALYRSIRRGLPRLEAMHYFSVYGEFEEDDSSSSHLKTSLLRFSKLDFNMVQAQHQQEVSHLNKWWKDLEVTTKLPYARDRIVELYFWILAVYFEPKYALGRRLLTKLIAVASIIDDTYDNYGSLEELELFAKAIKRWEIIDELPDYMKLLFTTILKVVNEVEHETAKEGRSDYSVHYVKEEVNKLVHSYLFEARWLNEGHVPTMEEYMPVALISCGYQYLSTNSFVGMGEFATKEAFEWVSNFPKIVKASCVINRLMDDIVSKFEKQRQHVATGIECYMKQHGISEEEVVDLFKKQVESAWKDINEEFLKPTIFPVPLLDRVLNLTRAMDVLYKDEDKYINPALIKDSIASLLKDPIPI